MSAASVPERPVTARVEELRRRIGARPQGEAVPACIPTGLEGVDGPLGGLPRGRLIEVVGRAGRMTLTLGALAGATAQQELAALVDPADALDPRSARVAGVVFDRLLWVRPDGAAAALRVADLLLGAGSFALVVLYLPGVAAPARMAHAWPRLAQRAAAAHTACLLVGDRVLAGSFAAATFAVNAARAEWGRAPGGRVVLRRQRVRIELQRSRLGPLLPPREEALSRPRPPAPTLPSPRRPR